MSNKTYVHFLVFLLALILLPIVTVNFILGTQFSLSNEVANEAHLWQKETDGIVSVPSSQTRLFKHYRLDDMLAEVNTVVLGSSNTYSIKADMFPSPMHVYNASSSAHKLSSIISQAEYVYNNGVGVKWLVIDLNWFLGEVYDNKPFSGYQNYIEAKKNESIPLGEQLSDAMSLPRILDLLDLAEKQWGIITDSDKEFHWLYGEYRCKSNEPAKDYDTRYMGECDGFRSDGSITFEYRKKYSVTTKERTKKILKWADPGGLYFKKLFNSNGIPNEEYLMKLKELADLFRTRGGDVLFIMTPLFPGIEQRISENHATGDYLSNTKSVIETWSMKNGIHIIDSGRSESFGCEASEFIDGHHALSRCFSKIFEKYWSSEAAIVVN